MVAENAPWPAHGGGLVRLARIAGTMAEVTDLDLFFLHDAGRTDLAPPPGLRVGRWAGVPYPGASAPWRWRPGWALRRGTPLEVAMAANTGPRDALLRWARPPYDVVWFSTAAVFAWMGRPRLGPTIVDLMDLEDVKARLRADLLVAGRVGRSRGDRFHIRLAAAQARRNAGDWQRLQRSVAAGVERVVVTSDVDAARSGLDNVSVVPNTYPAPDHPAGDPSVDRPPVVLFQGSLGYAPNIDAAEWLVEEVAPRIRRLVPGVEVRLVGQAASPVRRLHRAGSVTVVGRVATMDRELATASVAAVPVRYGSGTRVKILESFAHRVPVVSTAVGAEGLDVTDGEHLLLADDPGSFADATVRLLRDPELRVRLTDAARRRYLERYAGPSASLAVRRLLDEVAASRTRT